GGTAIGQAGHDDGSVGRRRGQDRGDGLVHRGRSGVHNGEWAAAERLGGDRVLDGGRDPALGVDERERGARPDRRGTAGAGGRRREQSERAARVAVGVGDRGEAGAVRVTVLVPYKLRKTIGRGPGAGPEGQPASGRARGGRPGAHGQSGGRAGAEQPPQGRGRGGGQV